MEKFNVNLFAFRCIFDIQYQTIRRTEPFAVMFSNSACRYNYTRSSVICRQLKFTSCLVLFCLSSKNLSMELPHVWTVFDKLIEGSL